MAQKFDIPGKLCSAFSDQRRYFLLVLQPGDDAVNLILGEPVVKSGLLWVASYVIVEAWHGAVDPILRMRRSIDQMRLR